MKNLSTKIALVGSIVWCTTAFAGGYVYEDNTDAYSLKNVKIQCDDGSRHTVFYYPDRSDPWHTATWSFESVAHAIRVLC